MCDWKVRELQRRCDDRYDMDDDEVRELQRWRGDWAAPVATHGYDC
jgi:hypothetical protein